MRGGRTAALGVAQDTDFWIVAALPEPCGHARRKAGFFSFRNHDNAARFATFHSALDRGREISCDRFVPLGNDDGHLHRRRFRQVERAMKPDFRPITSTRKVRSWELAVSRIRSIASIPVLTAVSKPIVSSVPGMSLSIVPGTPIVGNPFSLLHQMRRP